MENAGAGCICTIFLKPIRAYCTYLTDAIAADGIGRNQICSGLVKYVEESELQVRAEPSLHSMKTACIQRDALLSTASRPETPTGYNAKRLVSPAGRPTPLHWVAL